MVSRLDRAVPVGTWETQQKKAHKTTKVALLTVSAENEILSSTRVAHSDNPAPVALARPRLINTIPAVVEEIVAVWLKPEASFGKTPTECTVDRNTLLPPALIVPRNRQLLPESSLMARHLLGRYGFETSHGCHT